MVVDFTEAQCNQDITIAGTLYKKGSTLNINVLSTMNPYLVNLLVKQKTLNPRIEQNRVHYKCRISFLMYGKNYKSGDFLTDDVLEKIPAHMLNSLISNLMIDRVYVPKSECVDQMNMPNETSAIPLAENSLETTHEKKETQPMEELRTCSHCKVQQSLVKYKKDLRSKDGFSRKCISCS